MSKRDFIIAAILAALLPLLLLINSCGKTSTEIVISTPAPPTPTAETTPAPVRVYLTGCVQQPGVYELPAHSIVDDFVTAAGGPTADADLNHINLAREPQHEEQVAIPCLPTPTTPITATGVVTETAPAAVDPVATCQPGQVNVNTANGVQLESLPGIGPSLAQRIIEHMALNGPFQTVEDLEDVPGIGPAALEKLRPHVCVRDE